MEQFLIENADRYRRLVAAFKPSVFGPKGTSAAAASPEIVVSTRVRPMLEDEISQGFPPAVYLRGATSTLDLHELRRPVRGLPTIASSNYTVDRVFGPDSTTPEIYDALVKPLIPWAWGGGVATLFAYGQTGSGKTYTISGLERHVADTLMSGGLDGERRIYVSIIELAGQTAYDLLNARKQISILEDSFGTTQMAGVLEHLVADKESLVQYIEAAASLRRTAPTLKNDASSRSHAICRLRFENPLIPSAEDGLLYLVDLAGSEAARDKAGHDSSRMKEAREINTSMSVLKDCIRGRALADADAFTGKSGSKKPAYVPFRQSTLTKTLKHVFDPSGPRSCKTVVVACVNPCLADVGASKNTLRYAEMLRVTLPKAKAAEYSPAVPATWNNDQLRDWVERNSGDPAIHPSLLAPTETGAQLLRLPVPEFLSRCLKTPGASIEQAQAFHSKLWKLHIDSQRSANNNHSSTSDSGKTTHSSSINTPPLASLHSAIANSLASRLARLGSSADPEPDAASIPFRQRIRPGMVVSWAPPAEYASLTGSAAAGKKSYAVVLCPARAVGERVRDLRGAPVRTRIEGPPARTTEAAEDRGGGENGQGQGQGQGKGQGTGSEAYLCALVTPSILPGSFGVLLWMQVVVEVEHMEAEVLMEWDEATRYYYRTV